MVVDGIADLMDRNVDNDPVLELILDDIAGHIPQILEYFGRFGAHDDAARCKQLFSSGKEWNRV